MPRQEPTRARVELGRILEKNTLRAVGTAVGVHHTAVQQWANGSARPDVAHRKILFALYGIKEEGWLTKAELAEIARYT